MRMPDVLKNPSCDKLAFIGPMPEDLPFEIDEGSQKEYCNAKENSSKFWEWYFPDPVKGGERSNENNQKQWRIMKDEECP